MPRWQPEAANRLVLARVAGALSPNFTRFPWGYFAAALLPIRPLPSHEVLFAVRPGASRLAPPVPPKDHPTTAGSPEGGKATGTIVPSRSPGKKAGNVAGC